MKFAAITRDEYDALSASPPPLRTAPVTFSLVDFEADSDALQRAAAGGAAMISVVKPGLSTTVQDLGRVGYYDVGIPPSGALDLFSLTAANLLVGNAEGAAGLELAYLGPVLEFGADAVVAVCGGELTPKVDGSERPLWEAFEVPAGATLSFAHLRGGARAYVAVAGGIDVPELLGLALDLRARLSGRAGGPAAGGGRLAAGGHARAVLRAPPCRRRCGRRSPPSSRSASSWASTTTC